MPLTSIHVDASKGTPSYHVPPNSHTLWEECLPTPLFWIHGGHPAWLSPPSLPPPLPAQPAQTCQGSHAALVQLHGLRVPQRCLLYLVLQDEEVAQLGGHVGIRGCSHEGSFDEAAHQLQNRRMLPTLQGTDMGMGKPVTPTCLNKAMLQMGDTLAGLGGSQESPRSTVCPGSCPASKEPPYPTLVAICVEQPPGMEPLKGPSPMSGHSHWSSKSPGGFSQAEAAGGEH